jgi:hypothetical protein
MNKTPKAASLQGKFAKFEKKRQGVRFSLQTIDFQ